MRRSHFLKATLALTAPAILPLRARASETLKAPRLRTGDLVGLVSPAGPMQTQAELQTGIEQIKLLGLVPVVGKHAMDKWNGHLGGTDAARAEDINTFARDPKIRGIFALRGGYGTMRILEAIDYRAFAHDPKVVFGFSDLTALLNAITSRTGLVTFHGPVAALSTYTPTVVQEIQAATMSGNPIGVLKNTSTVSIIPGRAQGKLVGGNLTLVSALTGTPFAVPSAGNILLLEDVHEEPYRIDQLLTTLLLSGDLQRAAGIAVGAVTEPDRKVGDGPTDELVETLRDRLAVAGRPAVRGMQFGHILNQWVLPLGLDAVLDATAGSLTISEAAVI
ncbi:MAG: LD-carboxypeptidase [Candidatus Eremiobacteraeota bacterium]|nr:LD-carboxypeptidase [Candidatus Eremiobacteraeota bacterium]